MKYFRNFKMIGIVASLAVTAVTAALFVGCADGNSGGGSTRTPNAVEIRVEIDAQNLRLIDNGANTVAITIRTVPALSTIAGLESADTISLPIVIGGEAVSRVEKSEGGDFELVVPKEEIPITISTTATSKTISLRVRSDSGSDNDSFTVRIGTLTLAGRLAVTDDYAIKVTGAAGTTLPSNKELTVIVVDSEKPSISAQVNPDALVEGAEGNLELTLNNPPSEDVAVTASVGNDIPLTLDGRKSAMRTLSGTTTTISIPIASIDNNQNEADVFYTITIETTTAEVVVVHPMLTFTVRDDDIPQLSISPSIATIDEDEGGRTATFTITASTAPYRDIMVGYTIDGTGGADSADYTDANNGMVTIRKGTRTASISIKAFDDVLPNETSEGLTLTLGSITPAGGATIDETRNSTAITIRDNDGIDTDRDGIIDGNDRCSGAEFATGWTSTAGTDADRDGCRDSDEDIDDDGDGLIEINTLSQLNNMRHNLAGTSYREAANTTPITMGAPTAPTENCTTTPLEGEVYLCGYELMSNLDFDTNNDGTWNTTTLDLDIADHNAEYFPITSVTEGGWIPIGDGANQFNAIFEGNDHIIANLAIRRRQARIGLFGEIGTAAHVRNIGLSNYLANHTGTAQLVPIGGLAGNSRGTITASYAGGRAKGSTAPNDYVGGLVGRQDSGSIVASYATGSIDGGSGDTDYVGGLVGRQDSGSIIASYASATTGGYSAASVGGLVGYQNGGTIIASYATGRANGDTNYYDSIGGLVGSQNGGTITASYAIGGANGGGGGYDSVGGLVGWQNSNGTITVSYATGRVDGGDGTNDSVGSLVGAVGSRGSGIITASYGFGLVAGKETDGISPLPPGGTTLTDLTEATAGSCTVTTVLSQAACTAASGIWTSWNAQSGSMNAWDFGDSTQAPALRFADYDGSGGTNNIDYCGTAIPAKFADGSAVTCGTGGSLVPGQSR